MLIKKIIYSGTMVLSVTLALTLEATYNTITYFQQVIHETLKNSANKDYLFETAQTVIIDSQLNCREKIGAFAILKFYEAYHPINEVILQLEREHPSNIATLLSIINSQEGFDCFVFINSCGSQ